MNGLPPSSSYSSSFSSSYSSSFSSSYPSSSSSSSSSSSTSTPVYATSHGQAIRMRAKIVNPTESNLSEPKFRAWIANMFMSHDANFDNVKTELIKNVQKRGTEVYLNELLGRFRAAGIRLYFPDTEMGNIDSAFHNAESDKLVWLIHATEGDRSEFETHLYQFDSYSKKWIPADVAKENKYSTGKE